MIWSIGFLWTWSLGSFWTCSLKEFGSERVIILAAMYALRKLACFVRLPAKVLAFVLILIFPPRAFHRWLNLRSVNRLFDLAKLAELKLVSVAIPNDLPTELLMLLLGWLLSIDLQLEASLHRVLVQDHFRHLLNKSCYCLFRLIHIFGKVPKVRLTIAFEELAASHLF